MDSMTLTEKDIDEIERVIDERVNAPEINRKLDKILAMLADFAGRLKGVEDEQTIQYKQNSEYGARVEALERIHPQGQHTP